MIKFNTIKQRVEKIAREELKEGLAQCTEPQRGIFMKMYSEGLGDIGETVNSMPSKKLDWAMQQVQRTLDENNISSGN